MALASSAPRRCGVALQPRRRSRCPPRAAAASPAAAAGDSEECAATFVTATNAAGEAHTTIRLQAAEFPGLLRVIAWALQGLSIHVARAMLHTTSDGVAEDVLLVTDAAGQPLTDDRAACVASRLAGLLDTCVRARVGDPSLLERGPVLIDSSLSPAWSLVRVKNEEPGKQQQGVCVVCVCVCLGAAGWPAGPHPSGCLAFLVCRRPRRAACARAPPLHPLSHSHTHAHARMRTRARAHPHRILPAASSSSPRCWPGWGYPSGRRTRRLTGSGRSSCPTTRARRSPTARSRVGPRSIPTPVL